MYRKGWLFFGVPDVRPTAVPEKDFYLFFVPPFKTPKYKDTGRSDELVFKLKCAEEFDEALRFFAATKSLSMTSAYKGCYRQGQRIDVFNTKATSLLLESLLWANKDGRLGFEDMCRHPGLFGFKLDWISAGMVESLSNSRVERMAYGMSDEYMCLRAIEELR